MKTEELTNHVSEFEQHRSRLFGLAYRMLGMRAEAEDIVQETYLRWHAADHSVVRSPEAWLVTVATRLCIDRLRALEADRVSYFGEWLPEPIVDLHANQRPDRSLEQREDISVAFLYVLQRLAPEERAAFLLHEVLDVDYPSIAEALGKSEPAIRQMVHRARERVKADRPRFEVDEAQHRAIVGRFVQAVTAADENALIALFAENATWTSDGGGKAAAAVNVLHGAKTLTRFVMGVRAKAAGTDYRLEFVSVNGTPGLVAWYEGRVFAVYSFDTDGAQITGVYTVLNPDKLKGVA